MSSSARAWQSLPSVPGRSSSRMVNSLVIGMMGPSFYFAPRVRAGKFLRGEKIAQSYADLSLTATVAGACGPCRSERVLVKVCAITVFPGTGYSSLSYLHRFPLDALKIDRSFISGMGDDGEGMEIARTILPMANNLRLDVVAEGVETLQQVALLKKLRCKYGQGYYFSKPLSAEGTAALLAADLAWQACEQTV